MLHTEVLSYKEKFNVRQTSTVRHRSLELGREV